jgi:hypothetical protein
MDELLGGGSHFLCIFDGNRHINCGCSYDWADSAKFTAKALRIIEERFEIGYGTVRSTAWSPEPPSRPAGIEGNPYESIRRTRMILIS